MVNQFPQKWAFEAAQKVIDYINDKPPDLNTFASVIQNAHDKYYIPKAEPVQNPNNETIISPINPEVKDMGA